MNTAAKLDEICEKLTREYGDTGRTTAENLRIWLSGKVPSAYPEILERHLDSAHLPLLLDAFWQVLPFGTGGRRGRVGYGPNRINPTTIGLTVQGHCRHLRAAFPDRDDLAVVVANDVRVFFDDAQAYDFLGSKNPIHGLSSRALGKLAAEIYAGNGFITYFADPSSEDAVLTTPELSYLINELGAVGGINISASHNPPDDNGIKVYDEYGSQPVAPNDQRLVDAMLGVDEFKTKPFEVALAEGRIRGIPDEYHDKYVQTYLALYDGIHEPDADLPIAYTPLNGCGMTTVGSVLRELGFPLVVPPEQEVPDGSFEAIPLKAPNPEVPQAHLPARAFADAQGATIVISSDPDADRVGLQVKLPDGSWYHFDGNQISAILAYFLMLDPRGPRRKGLVIETLVTTKILGQVVESAGHSFLVDDLLVGFKYIADVLKTLGSGEKYNDVECSPDQLVLAAEESHGVMMIPTIRDKDATPACIYLAALHQRLVREDKTLLDYYAGILEELGGFDCFNRSIMMRGAEGMLKKTAIMNALRESHPETLGGQVVRRVVDYWDTGAFGPFRSETDRMPRDVLQIFTDAFVITIRPSGTEPKLKYYCQLLPGEQAPSAHGIDLLKEVRLRSEAAAAKLYNDLLSRIDIQLNDAALLVPDIVDLDLKRHYGEQTVPAMREGLDAGRFATFTALLDWLRGETSEMTPGTDPLPALKTSVGFLCKQWSGKVRSPLLAELKEWTES